MASSRSLLAGAALLAALLGCTGSAASVRPSASSRPAAASPLTAASPAAAFPAASP